MENLKASFEAVASWCERYLEAQWGAEVGLTYGTLLQALGRLATLPSSLPAPEREARVRELQARADQLLLMLAVHRLTAPGQHPAEGPRNVAPPVHQPYGPVRPSYRPPESLGFRPNIMYDTFQPRPSPPGRFTAAYDTGLDRPTAVPLGFHTNLTYDTGPGRPNPAAPLRATYTWDGGHPSTGGGTPPGGARPAIPGIRTVVQAPGYVVFSAPPGSYNGGPAGIHASLADQVVEWQRANPTFRVRSTMPIQGPGGQTVQVHIWFDRDSASWWGGYHR